MGVFKVLTLASMVTNSARLWVFPWYSIDVHGAQQCQVVGVFMVLTLASMVTSSARLWVCSWYLH